MFLIGDTRASRRTTVESYLRDNPAIAVLAAAIDFEFTVRRAILALGCSPTPHIRRAVLAKGNQSGLVHYKDCWKTEVIPRLQKSLPDVVGNDWQLLTEAFKLRGQIVHGRRPGVKTEFAEPRVKAVLAGSDALTKFATDNGERLDARIYRSKSR